MEKGSTELGSTINQQSDKTKEHEIINISSQSSPPLNLPCGDLLGSIENSLYSASISADWQAAKAIFKERPELVRFAITDSFETPLHFAVSIKGSKQMTIFVQKLVQMMEPEDLKLQDKEGNTALCSAVIAGNLQLAKLMVKKDVSLLTIPDKNKMMPLYLAAQHGKHDMARYLYDATIKCCRTKDYNWTPFEWGDMLVQCIDYDLFDVAGKIVTDIKGLYEIFGDRLSNQLICRSLLSAFARKPGAFKKILSHKMLVGTYSDAMKILRYIWGHIKDKEKSVIDQILLTPLFVAAELGNTAFVVELFGGYRDLIWKTNDHNHTIIHIAVLNGHKEIYNLIHQIGCSKKNFILTLEDKNRNNMLHLFGLRSGNKMTRRITQFLQEYRWYKEVEMMLPLNYRGYSNSDGKTAYELFFQNSQQLSESLSWADYGLVVATLVLGTSFATTCSVPGGFDQNKGYPLLKKEHTFSVFVLAETVAFLASVVSVLAFLSIGIFGRRHKDIMYDSLAVTVLLGITTLLLSIMAMMVAFGANLIILYNKSLISVITPMLAFFSLIILTFIVYQFPLIKDMFISLYYMK